MKDRSLWRRIFLPRGLFTPAGLLVRAAVLAALFGLAHLLGLREHTSVFSLTTPLGGSGLSLALGSTYAVLYLLFVLVAPVMALGALLLLGALLIRGRRRGAGAVLVLLLPLASSPARGNIAAPWTEGDPAADPEGDFKALEILREELDLDLRPLARGEPALVTVLYHLRNRGEARRWEMVFVTPGLEQGTVKLDGVLLARTRIEQRRLPEPWRRQPVTPSLGGSSTTLATLRAVVKTLTFEVATGAAREHRIEVRYRLTPPARHREDLYKTHQVVYLLAPARQWGGFGTLQVRAELPAGWNASARPHLDRRGDELRATFQGLPADVLSIALGRPAGLGLLGWALPLAALLFALVLGWKLAGWLGRRLAARGALLAVLAGLGTGLLAALLVVALPVGGLLCWERLLDATQVSNGTFYDYSMTTILLGPPVALLWGVAVLIVLLQHRRRFRLAADAQARRR